MKRTKMSNHEDPPVPGGYRGDPNFRDGAVQTMPMWKANFGNANCFKYAPDADSVSRYYAKIGYGWPKSVDRIWAPVGWDMSTEQKLAESLSKANKFINDLNRLLEQHGYAQSTR
jgi:hypothetical protein